MRLRLRLRLQQVNVERCAAPHRRCLVVACCLHVFLKRTLYVNQEYHTSLHGATYIVAFVYILCTIDRRATEGAPRTV
jgi:hypothetical protein